jgi:hypothetical protein
MITIRQLALNYISARRSCIHEFSGDIEESLNDFWIEIEFKVNPLLVKHGETPILKREVDEFDGW